MKPLFEIVTVNGLVEEPSAGAILVPETPDFNRIAAQLVESIEPLWNTNPPHDLRPEIAEQLRLI